MKLFKRKKTDFNETLTRTCKNCGHEFKGRFCNLCGEKVIEPEERSAKHFLAHVFNAFTFIDGKFWNSLKTLLRSPGTMSFDMMSGKRQPYMKSVAFFFVANFIYFLIPIFETFNSSLNAQLQYMPYSYLVKSELTRYCTENNTNIATLTPIYNAQSTTLAKMLLILLAPLFFPIVALVNFSRNRYLSDHFLFSMEYSSFLLFVPSIIFPLLLVGIIFTGQLFGTDLNFIINDRYTIYFIIIFILYFFVNGNRNFYQYPWWRAILSASLLTCSMYLVIHAYRFILFKATMWTI